LKIWDVSDLTNPLGQTSTTTTTTVAATATLNNVRMSLQLPRDDRTDVNHRLDKDSDMNERQQRAQNMV
jgi:hypothetical protein